MTATPVTAATQEVRFATAMTGGVSLAIWMGGVARELNLLDQASRRREGVAPAADTAFDGPTRRVLDLYGALLDELDLVTRVDVLAGTSAGGINAGLLGVCHANGWDLGWLRDVWLHAGDLDLLLRNPADKHPPSLLRGDGVLLQHLHDHLGREHAPQAAEVRPTTVHITATLLSGETSRFTDGFGTLVPDVDHLGVFRFDAAQLRTVDGRRALALAARASASFPVAFEPAFLPFGQAVSAPGDGPAERPAVDRHLAITRSHWAADGGILANRPIRPILDTIFAEPARGRQVRRVLLYVVPNPGGGAERPATGDAGASIDRPPSLTTALVGDVTAALNQSIAAELGAIRTHNERVDALRESRLRLAELGAALAPGAAGGAGPFPTPTALADYLLRQAEDDVRPVVAALMRRMSTVPSSDLPEAWRSELAFGTSVEAACRVAAREELRRDRRWPPPDAGPAGFAALGRAAFDGVKGITISLIHLAHACSNDPADRRALAELGRRVHESFVPAEPPPLATMVRTRLDAVGTTSSSTPTPALTEVAIDLARARAAALVTPATPNRPSDAPSTPGSGFRDAWQRFAAVVADLVPALRAIADRVDETSSPRQRQAHAKLAVYLDYLGTDTARSVDHLVGLHVMERSMLPVDADVDQRVELVQVSATTRTLLDDRATPADKLTGVQFHHFGAFYKSSWRANDWMWGRLDGAGWLVHVLLEPRRLLTIVDGDPERYPVGRRAETFLARLEDLRGRITPHPLPAGDAAARLAELRFLDDAAVPPPTSLPATSSWLAAAAQHPIVEAELPVVAREALATPSRRDQSWAGDVLRLAGQGAEIEAAARLATARISTGRAAKRLRSGRSSAAPIQSPGASDRAAELVARLRTCPVPGETLTAERGEPLFTKVITKATAVATAAVTAIDKPPASIAAVFSTARTTTLTGYRAVDTLGVWPRRLILAGLGAVAVGILLGMQSSTALGVVGVTLVLTGLYLVAFGAWSISARVLGAALAFTLVTVTFALTIPATRRALFGDGTDDGPNGWVVDTAVPFLRDRWWSIPGVLAVLILVPASTGWVWRRLRGGR